MGYNLPEIVAGRIIVADDHGRPRIVLGLGDDGQPALSLFDERGTSRAILALRLEPEAPDDVPGEREVVAELNLSARNTAGDAGEVILLAAPAPYAAVELLASTDATKGGKAFVEASANAVEALVTDGVTASVLRVREGVAGTDHRPRP